MKRTYISFRLFVKMILHKHSADSHAKVLVDIRHTLPPASPVFVGAVECLTKTKYAQLSQLQSSDITQ